MTTLRARLVVPQGRWQLCARLPCGASDSDWGADSLTAVLALRWHATHAPALRAYARALERGAPAYRVCRGRGCTGWSDVPLWDAVSAMRRYGVTDEPLALAHARAAYASVARTDLYARGACPEIDYQRPFGGGGGLKTLETDANRVLAAALLARRTGDAAYLADARRHYAAIRHWFFDRRAGLYTVYVFDDGHACRPLRHRFFASVNGIMIDAGRALAHLTGDLGYARDARDTARATAQLDDARGIFVDLQAGNDVVEPLVRALAGLADAGDGWSRRWLIRNALAAAHARGADGEYDRFFDGPPPAGPVTAWQTSGGLALAVAAGALAPAVRVTPDSAWRRARPHPVAIDHVPATLRFSGSGIALLGAIGERCCEAGRARVAIDGRPTFDATGIWQNKSSAGRTLPHSVLFAWRWPRAGQHVLRFEPGTPNAKEGGAFLHVTEAWIVP
ncbi:MAG TPA: hypothetical protein VMD91_10205 [Candidatus Sulfotelmatobacter sp.]|nr:hypothetical protein [Candidatus Sulfotelmatobacter sp.]